MHLENPDGPEMSVTIDRYIINNGTHKNPVQVDSLYNDEKFFHNKITKWIILICTTYNPVTHNNNKKYNWEIEILLPVSVYITEDLGGADFSKCAFLWLTMLMCPRTKLAWGGGGGGGSSSTIAFRALSPFLKISPKKNGWECIASKTCWRMSPKTYLCLSPDFS